MNSDFRSTLDRQLSSLEWTAQDTYHVLGRMRGERPVKRRFSAGLVLALILILFTVTAVAVGAVISQFYTQIARMDGRGQLEQWAFSDKLIFVTAMKEAELAVDETDWAILTNEALPETQRNAAADRIVYARYGKLQEEENALRPYPKETVLGLAPEPVVIFRERYLSEHPGTDMTDQAYRDALGYWLRDEYYPQMLAALPSATPEPRKTETSALTESEVIQALQSDMTEVWGWPWETMQKGRYAASYDAEKDLWFVQGDLSAADAASVDEEALTHERIRQTETGWQLFGYYALTTDGSWCRASSPEECVALREERNRIIALHTIYYDEAEALAIEKVKERYGLTDGDIKRYFIREGETYQREDCVRVSIIFGLHNNWGNEWDYAAIVNLTTAQVDDVFTPDDLMGRLPRLAQSYMSLSYEDRLAHIRWYLATYHPQYEFERWPIEEQAYVCQLFMPVYEQEKAVMPKEQILLDNFCRRNYTLPNEDELTQQEAAAIARQTAMEAINAAYEAEGSSRRHSLKDMEAWEPQCTFAREEGEHGVWRFWLTNNDIPGTDIRGWFVWVDAVTGQILLSSERCTNVDEAL
ncbi:MAG: hypothetical protein IJ461_03590 [Clostridia bacterium]|nr:hypothetical protein [Clostridia bacterium]